MMTFVRAFSVALIFTFVFALPAGAGRAGILPRVHNVREVRMIDLAEDAQHVVAGTRHVAVVVVLQADDDAFVVAVGGDFLHRMDHRGPQRGLVRAQPAGRFHRTLRRASVPFGSSSRALMID